MLLPVIFSPLKEGLLFHSAEGNLQHSILHKGRCGAIKTEQYKRRTFLIFLLPLRMPA